jgi:predicted nucleic acid-binding Zn ribbon protein
MLKSFDAILHQLQSDPIWSKSLQLQRILSCWNQVVGATVAQHTQPLRLQQHQLVVATSTAAWAQNLALQRHLILNKLNPLLPQPLRDIRFISGEWHRHRTSPALAPSVFSAQPASTARGQVLPKPSSPAEAFQRWSTIVKQRSTSLPRCPGCQCPTPEHELQRWSMCGHCWMRKEEDAPPLTI